MGGITSSRSGSNRRDTTRSTMFPTGGHEIPNARLTVVRSVTCARYAASSSNGAVNPLLPAAHGTRSQPSFQVGLGLGEPNLVTAARC